MWITWKLHAEKISGFKYASILIVVTLGDGIERDYFPLNFSAFSQFSTVTMHCFDNWKNVIFKLKMFLDCCSVTFIASPFPGKGTGRDRGQGCGQLLLPLVGSALLASEDATRWRVRSGFWRGWRRTRGRGSPLATSIWITPSSSHPALLQPHTLLHLVGFCQCCSLCLVHPLTGPAC